VATLAPIRWRADINDVLMNTLGTALGFLAWRLAARRRA
jgi:glycopeptide antibiotics resistance protein